MKEEEPSASKSAHDPLSRSTFTLQLDQVLVETEGQPEQIWTIPSITSESRSANRQYLHFAATTSRHLQINPWGNLLISHSERFQEAELSNTYTSGSAWWEFFVPHTSLSLTAGVKDKKSSQYFNFDFSFKNSGRITLKLNLSQRTLKAWINGVQTESKAPLILPENGSWTPFVRIRESGTTLALNPFVDDPEEKQSQLNVFSSCQNVSELPEGEDERHEEVLINFKKDETFEEIKLVEDNLLLIAPQSIRVLPRNKETGFFELEKIVQKEENGEEVFYLLKLSEGEVNLLRRAAQVWKKSLLKDLVVSLGCTWMRKTGEQWVDWSKSVFAYLDSKLKTHPSQLINQIYQLAHTLLTRISASLNIPQIVNRLTEVDKYLISTVDRHSLKQSKICSSIPNHLPLLCSPALSYASRILNFNLSGSYLSVLVEANRILLYSVAGSPFKLGEYIFSKPIKKESQLIECAKEADEIKGTLGQPVIYKILKNCLKYADKVKPPEKLVKELESRREKMKEKQKKKDPKEDSKVVPNKDLQGTLIQMGFDSRIVRKALIQCNNASLQAAMDLILGGTIVIEEEKPVIPTKDWTCQVCTLVNARTATACAACEAPTPVIPEEIIKAEDKKEQINLEPIEEQISSSKLEQTLSQVFLFPTGMALAPIVAAGVFKTTVRFRLFALNPRFFTSCYSKGDLFADLISNTYHENAGLISSQSIQKLFNYLSPEECKERSLSWIVLEDIDVCEKDVKNIEFHNFGFEKQTLRFTAKLTSSEINKDLYFSLDSSKIYLEKQRSLTISPELKEKLNDKETRCAEASLNSSSRFNFRDSAPTPSGFEILLGNLERKEIETSQITVKHEELPSTSPLIPLYVSHSPQQATLYPNVVFSSPWAKGYDASRLWKNGIVLSNIKQRLVKFDYLTFEIKNKDDKIKGFFYFANDYTLKPVKIFRFEFEGGVKKMTFNTDRVKANNLVIVLEPHHEDKIVELHTVHAFGEISEEMSDNPSSIKFNLQKLPTITIEASSSSEKKSIQPTEMSIQAINASHDLTVFPKQFINNVQEYTDLRVTIDVENCLGSIVKVQSVELDKFSVLRIDAIQRGQAGSKTSSEVTEEFTKLLNEYLLRREKKCLQRLLSEDYTDSIDKGKLADFKQYLLQYVVPLPFNNSQRNDVRAFLGHFLPSIRKQKNEINLSEVIQEGLRSKDLTANGLEMLVWLNRETEALSSEQLSSLFFEVAGKIKTHGSNKEYDICSEESIFSPYLHTMGKREDSQSPLDKLPSTILLRKFKYSRFFTLDLFSCFKLRELKLNLDRTQTKNKLLVQVSWYSKKGELKGNLSFGFDYPVWASLATEKKGSNRSLSILLNDYDIQARYVQVEVSFTIHPFTACKEEIHNLADNQIIPSLFGSYIGQSDHLPSLNFQCKEKELIFIKKLGSFTKYCSTIRPETFLLLEEKIEEDQKLEVLKNALELKANRQKWLAVMMKNPSQGNLNYHYTLFATLAEEILRNKHISSPSSGLIDCLIAIMNRESGALLNISQKVLRMILELYPANQIVILRHPIQAGYLDSLFKKFNPFSEPDSRKIILKELNDGNVTLAKNSINLFSRVYDQNSDEFKEIFTQLHTVFLGEGLYEQCVLLHEKNGWLSGLQSPLIYELYELQNGESQLQRICKSAKSTEDIVKFLEFEMVAKGPSQALLSVMDELAERVKNSPIAGSELFSNALEWLDKEEEADSVPSNLIEKLFKASGSFTLNIETISFLIDRLFQLKERTALWGKIKTLPIIKQKGTSSILLRFSLKYISNWINTPQSKRGKQMDLFSIISQILTFVDQKEEAQKQEARSPETIHLLSKLLIEEVNWGGREGCCYLDRQSVIHLNITYHLAKLSPEKEGYNYLQNLIKWYVLNHNNQANVPSNSTTTGQFSCIQNKVWLIIVHSLENNDIHSDKIYKTIMQCLKDSLTLNRSNRYLAVSLKSKAYSFIFNLLKEIKNRPSIHTNIKHLLENHGFFKQILISLESLNCIENEDNKLVKEQELANLLELPGEQKPNDWLAYRKGAKNHVFEIKYEGKESTSLYFEKDQPFWPSVIAVGFETGSGAGGTILAPRQVLVEMGDNKAKMNLVGHLSLIPFETFEGFSVKVYAINLHRIKNKFSPKGGHRSSKLLKLTFISPYEDTVTDGAEDFQLSVSKQISYISFLSIQGYAQNEPKLIPEDFTGLVGTLDILSDSKYIEDMTDLLSDQSTAVLFQKSLKGISFLLSNDKFANFAHKFLLRACQVNSSLGEGMLNEYLKSTNSVLSAKMVGEIVLTSQEHSVSRIKRYYNSIIRKVEEGLEDSQIIPYIQNFSQTISTLQRNWVLNPSETESQICSISDKNIQFIIQKASENASFRRLARNILTSRAPLTFVFEPNNENIKQNIWQQLFSSSNYFDTQLLAALINLDNSCREWFVTKDYLNSTFRQIFDSLKKNDSGVAEIVGKLRFLTLLCRNKFLKEMVTQAQLDLQIFEFLVHGDSQGLLGKTDSQELRESLVNFIAVASLDSPNERIIGALLKDSLNTTVLQGSSKFVGEVFLPLLNSYSKTVVCVVPYSAQQNKILADLSSLQHFQAPSKTELKPSEKFILSSKIMNEDTKDSLYEKIKEQAGFKWGVFKLITNHGEMASARHLQHFKEAIAKKSEVLVLIQAEREIFGLFYKATQSLKKQNTLLPNKSSFIFSVSNNKIKTLDFNNKEPLVTIEKNDEGDSQLLRFYFNGKIIATLGFDGFGGSTVNEGIITGEADKFGSVKMAEYWYFDAESSDSYERVWVNQKLFAKRLLAQLSDCSFFRSEFKAIQNLSLLRHEPLYEFPSSLTVKELLSAIEILGKGIKNNASYELRLSTGGHVNQSLTLSELAKGASGELILDLLVDLEGVVDSLDLTSADKKGEFLPIRGILKYFEENDGVKSMIKAIKKSISEWSNASRKEKWMQYISQLQKFSGFPHFFGVYLREKETFSLLLDLLSGLPDKEADVKWDEKETKSSQRLLSIISDILNMENSQQFRIHALKHDFLITILERLKILTGTFARKYEESIEEEEIISSPDKKHPEDDGTKKIKKKKGVGYTAETNSNTKWMKGQNVVAQKKEFQSIEPIIQLIQGFLGARNWRIPHQILNQVLNSCLLPFVEECLRAGTLLEMSKHPEKYRVMLKLVRAFARQEQLVHALVPLSPHYQPAQNESLESLLKSLNNIANIFLSCLIQNPTKEDEISKELANDIIVTYNLVEEAVIELQAEGEEGGELQQALSLPLDKKYRTLMKELRFDYMDMKQAPNKIKHHYASNFQPNYKPNQNKMIRLAQELADISTALPHEHTNAIYVRCDKDRVDFMQALIMGSNGTPYGHGAYLFDVYFDDNYPNGPPKVNLTTTGHGKIRFNPNLYACGKVCLSLLGTWRGSASENWDPKVSTLLQVLLSIQAIIMSEEVYFNEPGFENEQGTEEGEKKNEAYSNIVRYGNIKFAMLQNIKNPPKGFESVIRRHFYLKKEEIMEECRKWQKYAEKRPANYVGLVNDHNSSWSSEFKKTKTQYKEMLDKTISELEEELNKLPAPSLGDLAAKQTAKRSKKKKETADINALEKMEHEEIDVTYEKKMTEDREMDINDEKVRDRWSRYIGAMGIDAVGRQSKADIMIIGLQPLALEVVKNIVLSGCRKLTIVDDGEVLLEDLAGGFFYQEEDIGKKRIDSILYKIRQLNSYVKVDTISKESISEEIIAKYTVVLATGILHEQQLKLAKICREKKIKFVSADCFGAACRISNDFGTFEVLDKNGEEPVQVMIKDIEISERGLVTLLDGAKHSYEDGEAVVLSQVEGMKFKEDQSKSINGAIRKIKVINFKSFQIGDTRMFDPYVRNGTAKNIKTPVMVEFPPLEKALDLSGPVDMDPELEYFDFAKQPRTALLRLCFLTLNQFRSIEKRFPNSWDPKDAELFQTALKKNSKEELTSGDLNFISQFAFSCKGNLPPLCAFFGGFVSQEIIKGITQKYKPVSPSFYLNFMEILPTKEEDKEWTAEELKQIYTQSKDRDSGLAAVIGNSLVKLASESRIFMVGAGAIGCELLKNFAMVGLGTGESGKIVITDPDHIENSNLNRQFLFREKHISKSKSLTAAATVALMNPKLKNHISALLERVCEGTREIFSNRFFGGLTAVANALDNVAARRYVDQRCVENQVALFESGTLGSKGHVQVILPFKTESYGSQNDPIEEGEIPHCTLKMFPEQTLHCVEWARDIFGRKFSLQPKALAKFLEKGYTPDSGDIKALSESLKMVTKGPKAFDDCIEYAVIKFYKYYRDDVMQLLYTYPLDSKTKNGEPFWRLPKRPPTPISFNPEDPLHTTFVMSLAVLTAKIYQIPFPNNFRSEEERLIVGKQAAAIKIEDFVPSDEKAKAILKETTADDKEKEENKMKEEESNKMKEEETNLKNEVELFKEILDNAGSEFSIKSEQFEKDDDANGHIDFIYAAANLRALNYKLEPMDWIITKLKAGRIVPALVTTTSCVAGLQTLQLLKYLKKLHCEKMRNSYLNLAVPSFQMSEPGQLQKTVLREGLSVTLWDKWELKCDEDVTFGEIYERLKKEYGLHPVGVLQGMSRVDFGKSPAQKKKFLSSRVLEKLQREEEYLDIVVLFTLGEEEEKMLEGVPPVRLHFGKK